MNRTLAYAIGPEAMWLLMLVVTSRLVTRNQPPTAAGNQQLELLCWLLPLVAVLLSFVTLAWARGDQRWSLMRIVFSGAIGICVVANRLCDGIDWGNDSSNSIREILYMISLSLSFLALLIGTVIAAGFFVRSSRS